MANIVLTKYCNLKCPYCFASQMILEENKKNITMDELNRILEWIEDSPDEKRIGLIGGEPTLHPNFKEILQTVNNFCERVNKELILFTNGIYLKQFLPFISPKMSILININNPDIMDEQQIIQLYETLDYLYKNNKLAGLNSQATLGCNLYLEKKNYNFFWNIVQKYNIKKIRLSVTTPSNEIDKDEYYKSMKNLFLNFVYQAKNNKVNLNIDCNHIPSCYFSPIELKLINEVCYDNYDKEQYWCEPCIDITPDFKATCCFGTYDSLTDCNLFHNCDEMRNYFIKHVMFNKSLHNNSNECKDCIKFQLKQCQGGCLKFSNFKINQN